MAKTKYCLIIWPFPLYFCPIFVRKWPIQRKHFPVVLRAHLYIFGISGGGRTGITCMLIQNLTFFFFPPPPPISQGPPRSGSFPQIWGNEKFQNWGNSPELGKWQIFDQFFLMEELIVMSYNYSGTCIIYQKIK